MSDLDDLQEIADQIEQIRRRFDETSGGFSLGSEDKADFVGLMTRAKALFNDILGPHNDLTTQLIQSATLGGGHLGWPSRICVSETEAVIRAAAARVRRQARQEEANSSPAATKAPYVDPARITDIGQLPTDTWDFAKLERLCRELNIAHEHDCHYAVAMLVRAITDHVPPIFGASSFAQVAAQATAGKSFKMSMEHLDKSLRNIADAHLHQHIRHRESLPTATQVDFSRDLDLLLGEAIRITR